MADLATLSVRVTSTGIEITNRELDKLGRNAAETERQTDKLGKTTASAGDAASRFGGFAGSAAAAIGIAGAAVGLATMKIVDYSDRMKSMQGQLALVTNSHEELNAVYSRALALANDTGQSIETTVTLYARLARSTEELNLSQDELFTVTKAINQSFVVSGASAEEAAASILQLTQAFSKGKLDGDEFKSVMETSPVLARALTEALRTNKDELYKMSEAGQLSAKTVVSALEKMSGSIDAQFQKMPMTVARATNEIRNLILDAFGKADLSPMIGSIEDLRAALNDPQIVAGITNIATALVSLSAKAIAAIGNVATLARVLGENFAHDFYGPAADDLDRMIEKITDLKGKVAELKEGGLTRGEQNEITVLEAEIKKLSSAYDLQLELINNAAKARDKESAATNASAKAVAGADKSLKTHATTTVAAKHALDDYVKSLDVEQKQLKESALQQAINASVEKARSAAERDGIPITQQQIESIKAKTAALYLSQQTMEAEATAAEESARRGAAAQSQAAEDAARAAEDAATASQKAAEDAMKPWDDALQGMAESIDSSFTQAWRDAFSGTSDGFKNFAGNLKNAFLDLLASMAHLAITRPIAMQFSAAMGGLVPGGASAGVAGATGAAGTSTLTGGLSSLANGLTAAGKGLYSALGTLTNDIGLFKVSNAFNAKAAATTGWTMAGDAAGGMAGAYLGNKVFGETSGIGATVGGIAGSALIPIPGLGAAIGSFVGAGLEKAAQKLFGQKNDGNNKGYANFDLTTGSIQAAGIGKSFSQESVDAASALADQVKNFSDLIGGSSLKANITVGGKEGIKYGNVAYGSDQNAFLKAAFADVAAASTKLNDKLKPLILGFTGTAEELAQFTTGLIALDTQAGGISDTLVTLIQNASGTAAEILQFSQAIVSISQQASINTVTNAIKEFTTVAPTAAAAYRDHTAELMTQISAFDGSASAAANLNNLLLENKTAAYEFAMAIQTIGQQLNIAAADQAEYIRQSVMSADQLRAARTTERDSLRASLDTLTDPQQIDNATKSILDLNRKIFDSLAEDQKLRRSEEFAKYAESTNAVAQSLLKSQLSNLQTLNDDINTKILNMLESAADKHQQAADTALEASSIIQDASQTFANAAQQLANGSQNNTAGRVEVDN